MEKSSIIGVQPNKIGEYKPIFGSEAALAVGVFIAQGPPVPIPNTEVKLCGAENTCLATSWENRSMPTHKAVT